jgi:acyl carrier protein
VLPESVPACAGCGRKRIFGRVFVRGPAVAARRQPLSEDPSVSVDPKEIERKVIEIVCEHLAVNKEQVTRATNFIEDIGADSLDIVELIMELEEEFDIQIPDDQAEKIKTVGEAIDYIQRETEKK